MRISVIIFLCSSFVYMYSFAFSQKIVRSSLNSFGNVAESKAIKLSQTMGQSGNTSVFIGNETDVMLSQGFQQRESQNNYFEKNNHLIFLVFPNPNSGSFSVVFDKRISGSMTGGLYNVQGKELSTLEMSAQKEMDLNFSLPAGIYFLRLTNNNGHSGVSKIIIF